jgi:outer membrane protein OmpA-like peptidoglycan-associated protein
MKKFRVTYYLLHLIIATTLIGCSSFQSRLQTQQRTETSRILQIIHAEPNHLRAVIFSDPCFMPDNTRLTPRCRQVLPKLLKTLLDYDAHATIRLTAYSDDMFDAHTAAFIAEKQASTIALYLWEQGIPPERLLIKTAPQKDFIGSHLYPEASYANRRVEITI